MRDQTKQPEDQRRELLPSDDELRDHAARHPAASVLILPRSDGRYAGEATNVRAVLSEFGLDVEYATDPAVGGTYIHKSADIVIPALLLLGNVGTVLSTIDGLVFLVRFLIERGKGGNRVSVKAGRIKSESGDEIAWVDVTASGDAEMAEAVAREALSRLVD